jgi:acyl dehydratase
VNRSSLETPSLFFEDLQVGMEVTSAGRTLTEADIVNFAGLSGDYNQLHVDAQFAAATKHGQRIAHGLLVLSIVSGLSTRTTLMTALGEQILGLLNLECRWKRACAIGDTLHVRLRIEDLRPTSNGQNGVVTLRRDAINQHGEVMMESEWKLLIAGRGKSEDER